MEDFFIYKGYSRREILELVRLKIYYKPAFLVFESEELFKESFNEEPNYSAIEMSYFKIHFTLKIQNQIKRLLVKEQKKEFNEMVRLDKYSMNQIYNKKASLTGLN